MGAMKDDSLYVVNGFYAAMRAKYVAPGASVYYYSVQWDSSSMSWADFRGSLLGATDPEAAAASSIRSQIALRWQSLGLESKPNVGDNGVHASASPFEGLCERLNWLGASLEDDLTGKALLDAGIKKATLLGWTKDPQVELDGSWGSLFDAFEDLSLPAVLKTAQKLGGDPFEECPNCTTNQAFVFIKPHANTLAVGRRIGRPTHTRRASLPSPRARRLVPRAPLPPLHPTPEPPPHPTGRSARWSSRRCARRGSPCSTRARSTP